MNRADISFWLSIAGFATSSVLALIKAVEFYGSKRVSLTVDTRLTGSADVGNTLTLMNKSSFPATVSYFELAWTEPHQFAGVAIPFTRKVIDTDTPLDPMDGCSMPLAPHGIVSIEFAGDHHFNWGGTLEHAIHLKVWLIGHRSPIWLYVTGPGSRRLG